VVLGVADDDRAGDVAGLHALRSAEDEELIDHLLNVFAPADGTGNDGRAHDEAFPAPTCFCGFTADTTGEMDAHFLRVFILTDSIGPDGSRHVPVP
jgi:hypothetical protein